MAQTLLRPLHKTQLQTILQAISISGNNLVVNIGYANGGQGDPYFYIVSDDLAPNLVGGTQWDNQNYYRVYKYTIVAVFQYSEDGNADNNKDAMIDLYEETILNVLQSDTVRNQNINWLDLVVTVVSAAFNPDPNLHENFLYKTFELEIRVPINISSLP